MRVEIPGKATLENRMPEKDKHHSESGSHALTPGCDVAGVELQEMIAADDFSSIWRTSQVLEADADCCMRVIPAGIGLPNELRERFADELSFWLNQSNRAVVDLYDCGFDAGFFFMIMRYMPDGSLDALLRDEDELPGDITDLALSFADCLRCVHESVGAHGNVKPTNVFLQSNGNVRMSDFLLPMWMDQFEAGLSPLRNHMQNPYRAPEQRRDIRDYDTRSDIFSFGLVLLHCVTGSVPFLRDQAPQEVEAPWPAEIKPIIMRCLDLDREERCADGFELYDQISLASGRGSRYLMEETLETEQGERTATVMLEAGQREDLERLEEARVLTEEGELDEALDIVEALPPETPGVDELLDRIEQHEATRWEPAEKTSRGEAARETGRQADESSAEPAEGKSAVLREHEEALEAALEEESQPPAEPAEETAELRSSETPPLSEEAGEETEETGLESTLQRARLALEGEKYKSARPLLEKGLRMDPEHHEVAELVQRFKRGRVRRSFLENIRSARRNYLSGQGRAAAGHWLEAARWLKPGDRRERLRAIASAAAEGTLDLSADELARPARNSTASGDAGTGDLTPEVQEKLDRMFRESREERRKWRRLLLGFLAFVIAAGLTFLWAVWG